MEVKMNQILKTLEGKPITDPNHLKGLSLGDICIIVLQAQFEDEKNLAADKKIERWNLAQRIHGNVNVDLKAEEITLLKELVGKGWGVTVVGQAYDMLDPVKK